MRGVDLSLGYAQDMFFESNQIPKTVPSVELVKALSFIGQDSARLMLSSEHVRE